MVHAVPLSWSCLTPDSAQSLLHTSVMKLTGKLFYGKYKQIECSDNIFTFWGTDASICDGTLIIENTPVLKIIGENLEVNQENCNEFFELHVLKKPDEPQHPEGKLWRRITDRKAFETVFPSLKTNLEQLGAYDIFPDQIVWERFGDMYILLDCNLPGLPLYLREDTLL